MEVLSGGGRGLSHPSCWASGDLTLLKCLILRGPAHRKGNIRPPGVGFKPKRCQFYFTTRVQLDPSGPRLSASQTRTSGLEPGRIEQETSGKEPGIRRGFFFPGNTWIPQELSRIKRQLRFPECHVWPRGTRALLSIRRICDHQLLEKNTKHSRRFSLKGFFFFK